VGPAGHSVRKIPKGEGLCPRRLSGRGVNSDKDKNAQSYTLASTFKTFTFAVMVSVNLVTWKAPCSPSVLRYCTARRVSVVLR
jgi:hypothetical protein